MKIPVWLTLFLLLLAGALYSAGCEFFAACPYDGQTSNQTGRIKFMPNGCQVVEYSHPGDFRGEKPGHKFWQACDCE